MTISTMWNQIYESVRGVNPVKVEPVDLPEGPSRMGEITSLLLRLALSAGLSLVLGKILLDMMDPTRKEKKAAEKRVSCLTCSLPHVCYKSQGLSPFWVRSV